MLKYTILSAGLFVSMLSAPAFAASGASATGGASGSNAVTPSTGTGTGSGMNGSSSMAPNGGVQNSAPVPTPSFGPPPTNPTNNDASANGNDNTDMRYADQHNRYCANNATDVTCSGSKSNTQSPASLNTPQQNNNGGNAP